MAQDRAEREEEERKRRLQLYVFVSRCVAYPFNSKQPTDMTKRQLKITKQQLESLQQRFQVTDLHGSRRESQVLVTRIFFSVERETWHRRCCIESLHFIM